MQQVGVDAVGGLRHEGADLGDDDVAHEVGVQDDAERLLAERGERVVDVELGGADLGADRAGRAGRSRPRAPASSAPSRHTLVTSRRRLPAAYACSMRSSGTSLRVCLSTSAGVMPAPIATFASAAALQAASQPSRSWLGSASAKPSSWACLSAASKLSPRAMASMMKLVVLLKTASKPRRRQSMSVNSSRLKTGRPSMTVLSKRMRRPVAAAFAATRSQFQAMGPLLAVTTSMPRSKAASMWPVATGA